MRPRAIQRERHTIILDRYEMHKKEYSRVGACMIMSNLVNINAPAEANNGIETSAGGDNQDEHEEDEHANSGGGWILLRKIEQLNVTVVRLVGNLCLRSSAEAQHRERQLPNRHKRKERECNFKGNRRTVSAALQYTRLHLHSVRVLHEQVIQIYQQ